MLNGAAAEADLVALKYSHERDKRVRSDGISQFVEIKHEPKFEKIAQDPWVDHAKLNSQNQVLKDGDHVKFLILGAGYGGLLMAVKLIGQGFPAEDIRIADNAGGFGGTWYWNRYPGLRCDVESYTYMPLLEETGYVPTSKYACGEDLREHANNIARKWRLEDKAFFRASLCSQVWDDENKWWKLRLKQDRGTAVEAEKLSVAADFVLFASGLFPQPQAPRLDGLTEFWGDMFHTSRWHYSVTGGSPASPTMEKLSSKVVGIIGTGATAIQAVPRLAAACKHLYVFQRTPSAVDTRGQRPTDVAKWEQEIATEPGWQRKRQENFNLFVTQSNAPGDKDMVDDGWTHIPSYHALLGTEGASVITPEMAASHVTQLEAADLPHMERIRARVDKVVKDKSIAQKLKPWYQSWCKRPTFSDEYLQTFNRSNVTLVDTDGKGVERVKPHAIIVPGGKEYSLDVLVLATGYRTPSVGNGSPATRAGVSITGRGGRDFEAKWQGQGPTTLHGLMTHGFPNFFFVGPSQAGVSANVSFLLDVAATHVAYVIRTAADRVQKESLRPVVEARREAEEKWTMQCMKNAWWYAGIAGCTPGYYNLERGGAFTAETSREEQMRLAKGVLWAQGPNNYERVLRAWREKEELEGVEVHGVSIGF